MYEYVAGLFDAKGRIDLSGKKPVLAIEKTCCGWPGVIAQLRSQIGGVSTKNEWRVVGWDNVDHFIRSIYDYTFRVREMDVVLNYRLYKHEIGDLPEARSAARFQLTQLAKPVVEPLTFDLETMGLEADTKEIISSSFQWGDREEDVFSLRRTGSSDKELCIAIRDTVEAAPFLIGFNSYRFDVPYLNTRLRLHGERPAFIGSHDDASVLYDRWRQRRKRTSLVKVVDELGLADDQKHKTPINWDKWNAAYRGDKYGMDYVLEHGENDVVLTKRVYNVTMSALTGW